MRRLARANLNYATIKLREHAVCFDIELEIVESEDCTNNLEEIVNNINIEDCGLSQFAGVNHHLQREKAFIHREVLEYRANKSRLFGGPPRANTPLDDFLPEHDDVSRILGASMLHQPNTTSRLRHGESHLPARDGRLQPTSQVLPTDRTHSYSNLGGTDGARPYSMRNVSPSSTFQSNVKRTRERLRRKSKNLSTSRIIPQLNSGLTEANKSANQLGFMSQSRMQKSLLTEMSVQSGKRPGKKPSTTWSLLTTDLLRGRHPEQSHMLQTGNLGLDFSRRVNGANSIMEITPSIQNSMAVNPSSGARKSVMHQYQKIRHMQDQSENLGYSSRHSRSQIEIGQ